MNLFYKRLLPIICACAMAIFCLAGCKDIPAEKEIYVPKDGLCVNYISVGLGDCIYIRLPDGKNILIDVGNSLPENYQTVKQTLDAYSVKSVDYLIITNPRTEHISGANNLIDDYQVKVAYLPNIRNNLNYLAYTQIKIKLSEKGTQIKDTMPLTNLSDGDYSVYFLSPCGSTALQGYYGEFNSSLEPNSQMEKDLSPIIYLEYKGVRFVFTGDASTTQESLVLTNYKLGIYKNAFPNINLYDIDFLKLGNHGGKESCLEEFIQLLNPKVGIISVGAKGSSNLPNTSLLLRILQTCPNIQMLRTDIDGTITVNVCKENQYEIYKN